MSKRKQKRARLAELEAAKAELADVRLLLGETYSRFNAVTDPAVLETCIYEISALQSKYNRAYRPVKALSQ